MNPVNVFRHFHTITKHKLLVMNYCFRAGLWKQGLLHDLSKYGFEEFFTGVVYYQGNRSPNAAERENHGFSRAWLHHKGRNKHHFEYWIDFSQNLELGLVGHKMPVRFVIEMMLDRMAASRVYEGRHYRDSCPWEYYERTKKYIVIHSETQKLLESLLTILAGQGEAELFRTIRLLLKKKEY